MDFKFISMNAPIHETTFKKMLVSLAFNIFNASSFDCLTWNRLIDCHDRSYKIRIFILENFLPSNLQNTLLIQL